MKTKPNSPVKLPEKKNSKFGRILDLSRISDLIGKTLNYWLGNNIGFTAAFALIATALVAAYVAAALATALAATVFAALASLAFIFAVVTILVAEDDKNTCGWFSISLYLSFISLTVSLGWPGIVGLVLLTLLWLVGIAVYLSKTSTPPPRLEGKKEEVNSSLSYKIY